MDLVKTLEELYEERKRLDENIAKLEEALVSLRAQERKRGRTSMSREERLRVSERMRKYWGSRRNPASK